MTLYNAIIKRSWQITKTHHSLWILGLFGILWGGKSLDLEWFFSNVELIRNTLSPFNPNFWDIDRWREIAESVALSGPWMALFGVGFIVVVLFVLALIIISQIGLVDAYRLYALEKDGGESDTATSDTYRFHNALQTSRHHFVSVLAVNVVGRGISYGLVALAAIPLFMESAQSSAGLYTWILLMLVTPVSVLVSILTKYAVNDIVVNNSGAIPAVGNAWRVFSASPGVAIELAIIMVLAYLVVNVGAMLGAIVIMMPFILAAIGIWVWLAAYDGIFWAGYLVTFAVLGAVIVSSAVFSAWHYGSWTLLFRELTIEPKKSKLGRLWKGEK